VVVPSRSEETLTSIGAYVIVEAGDQRHVAELTGSGSQLLDCLGDSVSLPPGAGCLQGD
jgi:hypothetical protein